MTTVELDHVELFVPDQHAAAAWCQQVFGLEIVAAYAHWAASGPLMIAAPGGASMLALFKGEPRGQRPTAGHHRVAFRTSGAGFLAFLARVPELELFDDDTGERVAALQPSDHNLSWSVYFCDPYGNRYELTTYDYAAVAAAGQPGA